MSAKKGNLNTFVTKYGLTLTSPPNRELSQGYPQVVNKRHRSVRGIPLVLVKQAIFGYSGAESSHFGV
jgi:hypothetical protein